MLGCLNGQANLYRIHGLEYTSSLRDGVGLLVSKNNVVERMIYGIPACDYRIMQCVEIL